MWTYHQTTGELFHDDKLIGTGYSGRNEGKNNFSLQNVHGIGPLCRGWYTIEDLIHDGGHLGPDVVFLKPDAENEMFGRSGFFMHGDSIANPGSASDGCIIQGHAVRILVSESEDRRLTVIE